MGSLCGCLLRNDGGKILQTSRVKKSLGFCLSLFTSVSFPVCWCGWGGLESILGSLCGCLLRNNGGKIILDVKS